MRRVVREHNVFRWAADLVSDLADVRPESADAAAGSGYGASLFDCWTQIARRVRATGTVRLFVDFDGTLAADHHNS